MTIAGIPLHPLVVHAAVVFAPLASLIALAYAAVPSWRWRLRHLVVVVALAAAGAVQLAAATGESLTDAVPLARHALVENHEMWAGRLQGGAWILAAAAAAAWRLVPHASPLPGGARTPRRFAGAEALSRAVVPVLVLAAVATLGLTVATGHAGAAAVWTR